MSENPWIGFKPATVTFCEANMNAWIRSPGIAGAGFAYLIVAFLIWRKADAYRPWRLKAFQKVIAYTGFTALIYHSSHIFIFQALDLSAMYLLSTAMILMGIIRIEPSLSVFRQKIIFYVPSFFSVLLFILHPKHPTLLPFISMLAMGLIFEFHWITRAPGKARYFYLALLTLGLGVLALAAEKTVLCNPQNHIFQFHGVWNIAAAVASYFLYQHYEHQITLGDVS